MSNKRTKTIILFLTLAAGLISAPSCGVKEEIGPNIVNVGDIVPEAAGMPKEGMSLLVFFNPSCPDCVKELPAIQELFEKYAGDISFLAVGRDMTTKEIEEYFNTNNYSIPFKEDPERKLYNAFALSIIPRCYLCKNGTVIHIWTDNPIMTVEDFEKTYQKNI